MTAAAGWTGVAGDDGWGLHVLALGSVVVDGEGYAASAAPRLVVRVGDRVLDLGAAAQRIGSDLAELLRGPSLDALLGETAATWTRLRGEVTGWLTDPAAEKHLTDLLHPLSRCAPRLPFTVADFVDFYASEHHAAAVGRLFRPGQPALPAAWKHLPQGYHGRAGTVVVSGTAVRRPCGLRREGPAAGGAVTFGPSRRLDVEVEVGFVLGGPTRLGEPVPIDRAADHVFGVVLLDDWSARDVQAFEYVPLGPFLGKSFATSVSPWVVPLAALDRARVAPPPRDVPLSAYLDDAALPPWGLDLSLRLSVNGTTVSRPPFSSTYWTVPQLVAHLTANGATVRAGDLIGSGTVSGPGAGEAGSLLEMGAGFLDDGDEVLISGRVQGTADRLPVELGEVRGRVVPAATVR